METVFRCLKINFGDAAAIKEGFCAVVVGLGGVQVLDGFGVAFLASLSFSAQVVTARS